MQAPWLTVLSGFSCNSVPQSSAAAFPPYARLCHPSTCCYPSAHLSDGSWGPELPRLRRAGVEPKQRCLCRQLEAQTASRGTRMPTLISPPLRARVMTRLHSQMSVECFETLTTTLTTTLTFRACDNATFACVLNGSETYFTSYLRYPMNIHVHFDSTAPTDSLSSPPRRCRLT